MQKDDKLNCGIYVRKSDDNDTLEHDLVLQINSCKNMAIVKDWEVLEIYSDTSSGDVEPKDRPGLHSLLTDATNKKLDAVLFFSLDTIAKNTRTILDAIDYLETLEIEIVSCRENIDFSTPSGRFALSTISSAIELEKENEMMKSRDKRDRFLLKGERGSLPYGYCGLDNQLSIDEEKAKVIRYIYRENSKGSSMNDVTDKLNEIKLISPHNTHWTQEDSRFILSNLEMYTGGYKPDSDFYWPQIVDRNYKDMYIIDGQARAQQDIRADARNRGINISNLGV